MDIKPDIRPINSKFLFYDYELTDCYNSVKALWDIFKRVKKRFDRKETLTISKSVCDFLQLKKDAELYPYVLYDFKCHSMRVCIIQRYKQYFVYCSCPNYKKVYDKYKSEWKAPDLYGGYDRLSDCVPLFVSIVNFVVVRSQEVELPF